MSAATAAPAPLQAPHYKGRTPISLPTPRFIVFYNGREELGDVLEMRLSDLYTVKEEKPKLELEAVEKAVAECIDEGILAEFLEMYRAEVVKVSIYEYDTEEHMRMEKEESYASGLAEGHASGLAEGHASGLSEGWISGENRMARLVGLLASAGRIDDIKQAAYDAVYRNSLFAEFGL